MDKKVIVAGHICLDITPVFKGDKKDKVSEVLMPGKLVEAGAASVSTGGAVANTGLAMKLLGADVRLMGKIGTDEFGDMICNILDRYGAESDMIRDEKESTSYSVVLAIPGIDRIFIHCPGTNNTYGAADVSEAVLKETVLFHFGYPSLMKRMYENSGKELIALFKKAKDAGCATSLDLAAVDPKSEAGRADWEEILKQVIPYVDFFVPSIEELCFMIDRKRYGDWQERAGDHVITEILDTDRDIRPLADRCMALGAKVLLLKCGAKGLYYRTAPSNEIDKISVKLGLDAGAWSEKEGFERSYKPKAVLSATGAGDTSIAAFLTAVLDGCPVEECVRLAAATGACCVSSYDALSGLMPFPRLREKIEHGWEKN
ncbi:MAG: carbohydrate kinase family protein [Lachnospiraceae bacterium]|nr:carbohydrate kinase family protein [Lachnospiraceae bacterium]